MATTRPAPMASPPAASGGKFPADMVPFVGERVRGYLNGEYSAAGDYKAFASGRGRERMVRPSRPNFRRKIL